MKSKIFVLVGLSGSGKTSIGNYVVKNSDVVYAVSTTTRVSRKDEIHGKDYYFVDKDTFLKGVKTNVFVEYAINYKDYYGLYKSELEKQFSLNKNVLLIANRRGAIEIQQKYPLQTYLIYVYVNSLKDLESRLHKRGTETPDSIKWRLAYNKKSYQKHKKVFRQKLFVTKILNEDLEVGQRTTLSFINQIIEK